MARKKSLVGRVTDKLVTSMTKREYDQCRRMGYHDGCIRDDLKDCFSKVPWSGSKVVLLKEGDAVRSWALIDQTQGSKPMVQIWTRPHFRRKGFGERVMARVKKLTDGNFDLFFGQAPEFFRACGRNGYDS